MFEILTGLKTDMPQKLEVRRVLPSKVKVCEGDKVILRAVQGIWPPPCVQWQISKDGGCKWKDLSGKDNECLIFNARLKDSGNLYRAIVSDKCECYLTNETKLIVNFIELVKSPISQCVPVGQVTIFMAEAEGNPEPQVQWQVSTDNGLTWENLPGETSTTLEIISSLENSGNLYRAVFRNICGFVISRTAGLLSDLLNENFDQNDGGFTVVNTGGIGPPNDWQFNPGNWSVAGLDDPTSSALVSPILNVPVNGELFLEFDHAYNFEIFNFLMGDGGNVKFSVNGGGFMLVPGGNFSQNGYNLTINSLTNPLDGEPVWSDQSPGWPSPNVTSIASLGNFLAGDTLQIEFIGGWDFVIIRPSPNWLIDQVRITCQEPMANNQMLAQVINPIDQIAQLNNNLAQMVNLIANETNPDQIQALQEKQSLLEQMKAELEQDESDPEESDTEQG